MSKKWVAMSILLTGVLLMMPPARAHHSFPATYLGGKTVTIQGTVVQFLFRNPHSFVHVMVPDKDGNGVTWAVEWGASGALSADNVKTTTLKPGDKVIVTGHPARDESSHRLHLLSIERPSDGWKWVGKFG